MKGKKYVGVAKNTEGKSIYCKDRTERILHPRNFTNRCHKGWGGRQCDKNK